MKKNYGNLKCLAILVLSFILITSCKEDDMEPVNPTAGFTTATNELIATFTNSSENVTSYSWNFGDGNTSTDESPSHTYEAAGIYTVVLTAKGANGKIVEADKDITIIENLKADYDFESEYLTVNFTNASENSVSYSWDFGDGNTSTEENPIHVYEDGGTYEVILYSTAQGGTTVQTTKEVTVVGPPMANYTFDDEGLTVNFANTSENVATYSWDFGDGSTSTDENPTHTYSAAGTYTVVLTATDEEGVVVVSSQEVTVEVPVDTSLYSIVFITDDSNDDAQIEWLREKGFNVSIYYNAALSSAPQEDIDMLNAADLVIIGRSGNSGDFDGSDKAAWNALTAPQILNSQWAARNNRLNWFDNNGNPAAFNPTGGEIVTAQVFETGDEVFDDVTIEEGNYLSWLNPPANLLYVNTAPNGEVLATTAPGSGGNEEGGAMLFVRFAAGIEFYSGAGESPAGTRTYFGFGADEGGVSYYWQLTDEAKSVYFEEILRLVLL
ncbi:PKD domain-containing protein [Echinicola soli]|uniref:PKD domain-containing protein n=1 Tax=Echinicola soli TaxID=2591634 RepID=A0A514CGK9_9BACT|nr:PKD domain-containing protein [Echinicola soli]QDH78957.1 PKD domain-containing protein [Echinicola soli]